MACSSPGQRQAHDFYLGEEGFGDAAAAVATWPPPVGRRVALSARATSLDRIECGEDLTSQQPHLSRQTEFLGTWSYWIANASLEEAF
jgi:hypothetical protein